MKIQAGLNFEFLYDNFSFEKSERQEKQGFVLEGGSGSGKSFDIIQFLMYYCQVNENKGKDILIFRSTFADLKKTILKDFEKILRMYGIYEPKDHFKSPPVSYKLFGNIIYFSGLDGMGSHGERHDVIWGNEGMELDFEAWKQLNQRCNEMFITDYNPCFTDHWIFNSLLKRPDTKFFHSTLLGNAFLPKGQRDDIMAYEPTSENIKNGTADDSMWKIYGQGLRTAIKGLIFQNVTWIDEMVEGNYRYGLDFGFTNDPTCLTRYCLQGNNLYAECLLYEPIDNAQALYEALVNCGIKPSDLITADSSDKFNDAEMVKDLRNLGLNVKKVNKGKGILWRIGLMKKHKIHLVRNTNVKREQENYKWREINGQSINEPIDKFNHFWDSLGYGYLGGINIAPQIIW